MVKICIIAAFLLVAIAVIEAAPMGEVYEPSEEIAQEGRGDRQRRITCDLLSFGGVVQHSACAVNCLTMGKAGGRCDDGVCICRKTTFNEVWGKRFG